MLFLLFQILTAIAFFGINFIPQVEHNASLEFHCNDGLSDLKYCPNTTIDECLLSDLIREYPDDATDLLFNCDVGDCDDLTDDSDHNVDIFDYYFSSHAGCRKNGCWI